MWGARGCSEALGTSRSECWVNVWTVRIGRPEHDSLAVHQHVPPAPHGCVKMAAVTLLYQTGKPRLRKGT